MSNIIKVACQCPWCGETTIVECEEEALKKYRAGALIQDAFPDMDYTLREVLISGMCEDCQMRFFVEDEDKACDGECDICWQTDCPSCCNYFADDFEEET